MLHMCVDLTILPSGKLMLSGSIVSLTFFMGVPDITIAEVAPISVIACVSGIIGRLG